MLSKSGPLADANRYQFSSKSIHELSGMYDYLYRWYAPETQRWIDRDPIAERGGVNLYQFVRNNSIGIIDSFGLDVVSRPPGVSGPKGGRECGKIVHADGSTEIIWCNPDPDPQPLPDWMQPKTQCPKPGPRNCWKDPDPRLKATAAWQTACELAREACEACCATEYGQSGPLESCLNNCSAKAGACVQGRPGPTAPTPPPTIQPEYPPRPNLPPRPRPWP
jgi:RHS repeat-associated protein